MQDRKWIYMGLAGFLVVILFPVWFKALAGSGVGSPRPDLEVPEGECIRPLEEMRANHMTILDEWRDAVVREGQKMDGEHEMSLTRTCMSCHESSERFCKRCHDYAGVDPYCWDCHVDGEEHARE
jgi:hypothetical protein